MIREITIDGKVWTAVHWLKAGLPPCLHECLDGTRWLYDGSSHWFCDRPVGICVEAIERVFRFPNIEDTLEPLKLAHNECWKRVMEERFGRILKFDDPQANFLITLTWNLFGAVSPSKALNLTQKQIDENFDAANRAVRIITDNPLNTPFFIHDVLRLVNKALWEKSRHPPLQGSSVEYFERALDTLSTLERELQVTGISLSFGELLESWIKTLPSRQERGVSRPGRGDTAKRFFCVSLANNFWYLENINIYREVAVLATAVFSDTSEDYVRKAHERAHT